MSTKCHNSLFCPHSSRYFLTDVRKLQIEQMSSASGKVAWAMTFLRDLCRRRRKTWHFPATPRASEYQLHIKLKGALNASLSSSQQAFHSSLPRFNHIIGWRGNRSYGSVPDHKISQEDNIFLSKKIQSPSNPLVKWARKRVARREDLVLEGHRLVKEGQRTGQNIHTLFVTERALRDKYVADIVALGRNNLRYTQEARPEKEEEAKSIVAIPDRGTVGEIGSHLSGNRIDDKPLTRKVALLSDRAMKSLSDLRSPPGVIALCTPPRSVCLASLQVSPRSLFLVIAGVSDPRNLGAMLRTAEAAGVTAVFLVASTGTCSILQQQTVRGLMGSILRLPLVWRDDLFTVTSWLEDQGVKNVVAGLEGSENVFDFDWQRPVAVWFGDELGNQPEITQQFMRVKVPMAGAVESLNISVASALILYAAQRVYP